MFKRALAHQSNATPIRSSDRRKLVKDVFARYDFSPADADEDVQRELGRLIMPEGIRVSNMQTSGGIDGVSCRRVQYRGLVIRQADLLGFVPISR